MEYVVWGIPPGADPADVESGLAERPLYTLAETRAEADRVAVVLERDHGCRRLRVQVIDGESVQAMIQRAVAPVHGNQRRPRPAKR